MNSQVPHRSLWHRLSGSAIARLLRQNLVVGIGLFLLDPWTQSGAATTPGGNSPSYQVDGTPFRFGFSSASFAGVNENDAKASIKVWARMLFQERGLPVDPDPTILKDEAAIARALREQRVEAIVLNTDEYWRLGQDLRGRALTVLHSPRMSLAVAWLDTVLAEGGLPRAKEFCRVTLANKLSKAVLAVFFRQAEGCLVSRRGLAMMSELNPQVGQSLKVLATSPEFVPTGFCFRRDYQDPLKDIIVSELAKIRDSPAGAQVLTLFQCESLEAHPLSCLESAFSLLARHERLSPGTNSVGTGAASRGLDTPPEEEQ